MLQEWRKIMSSLIVQYILHNCTVLQHLLPNAINTYPILTLNIGKSKCSGDYIDQIHPNEIGKNLYLLELTHIIAHLFHFKCKETINQVYSPFFRDIIWGPMIKLILTIFTN